MRHRRRVKHFGRATGPRTAMLKSLVISLVEHGRIKTTVEKAKEIRRHVEKLITLGKKNDLATLRLLIARLSNETAGKTIMTDLSKKFSDRPGGYTRIIKLEQRPGDNAKMAFIEFVDFKFKEKAVESNKAK